jgi:anti-anti-sigma regulatory factor
MNCSLELSEETAKLFISGSLTIEDAAHLKTTLSRALAESSSIEVDLGAAESSDLSCLQILCSAHRAAVQTGKNFILLNTGMTLIACLEDAGFPRQAGCLQQYGEACLWQEENLP